MYGLISTFVVTMYIRIKYLSKCTCLQNNDVTTQERLLTFKHNND